MRIEIKNKQKFKNMFNNLFNTKIKEINGISIDSRSIQKNDIYIPIKGIKFDGHDFIDDAIKLGASKCFSENHVQNNNVIKINSSIEIIKQIASCWNKESKHKVIGVTGSNGKTTTKELLYHVLSKKYSCSKSEGNYNSTIGLPLSYLSADANADFCILEYGANKLNEIDYLCKIIKPNISLITNITNAHIENFKSIKNIIKTKESIFKSVIKNNTAFINKDDQYISNINVENHQYTYSFKHKTDYTAKYNLVERPDILKINNKILELPNNLLHLTDIILPVYAISSHLGLKHNEINDFLKTFKLPSGRGNQIIISGVKIIDDCYNANPSSVKLAINRLNSIDCKGKKILIFGDMLELGNISIDEHNKIAELVNNSNIDICITYGTKTKHTNNKINNEKIKKHFSDITTLKKYLIKIIRKDDLLYIKGSRSMNLENIYKAGLA